MHHPIPVRLRRRGRSPAGLGVERGKFLFIARLVDTGIAGKFAPEAL